MQESLTDQYRLKEKVAQTLKFGYFTSVLSLLMGCICTLIIGVNEVVTYVFFTFGLVNLINTLAYRKHKNPMLTFNITSLLGTIAATVISLNTGGINSPFIFVLAIVVFAGYTTTRDYGRVYLYISVIILTFIFLQGISNISLTKNVVPDDFQNLFSFLSILFSVYLLGGVLGKNLIKNHHNLYKSKIAVEQQITEKETLLKEIHHRVKNNLQTVSSLLSLQSRGIEDEKMKSLIKSSQNRVISMAMVHEMLYMREDLNKIEYKPYVQELSEYLVKSVKGTDSKVKLDIDIQDIELGIDTAIPLGLLINETITNSLKYGFKDDAEGEIHIELKKEDEHDYVLNIGDDGIGFSDKITFKNTKSLGLKLIHNLTRQLKGTITRDSTKKGTNYILRFRDLTHHQLHPA